MPAAGPLHPTALALPFAHRFHNAGPWPPGPPLRGEGEERLTSDEGAVRIATLRFVLNALLLEIVPVAADPYAAQVQHGLRPGQRPVHARPLHTIFEQVPAGAFDHATGNRI